MNKILTGLAGSMGTVTGIARVIINLKNAGELQAGEILVTKATSPIWTPLIYVSSGVITEVGGVLSHAAIVCREYGIPAVVGTKNATVQVKSGQKITVDGNNGTVEIHI